MDNNKIKQIANQIFGNKHPEYKKDFLRKHKNISNLSPERIIYIKGVYDKFLKYKQLCLENNISPIITRTEGYPESKSYNFEELEDKIVTVINKNKAINLGKSVLRGYYKKLKNEETDDLLFSFITNGLKKEQLQKGISKVAAFQSSEELNNAIRKTIKENGYTKERLINEIKSYNKLGGIDSSFVAIDYKEKDNIVVLNIKDYSASEHFGSPQWCISYDETIFHEYLFTTKMFIEQIHGRGNNLFFIFDFSKSVDDPMFKIAPLFSTNGELLESFDQNDRDVKDITQNILSEKEIILDFLEKGIDKKRNNIHFSKREIKNTKYKNKYNVYFSREDIKNLAFFLQNESYNPIEECYEIITQKEEIFSDGFFYAGVFYNDTFQVVDDWIKTPYGDYILNKYPEKYLDLSFKIEEKISNYIENEDERLSIFYDVLFNINRKDVKFKAKQKVTFGIPTDTTKKEIPLLEVALKCLPDNEDGANQFFMIGEYISVKHTQYKMDNKEKQEDLLIEKFKEFINNEDTKYKTLERFLSFYSTDFLLGFKKLKNVVEEEVGNIYKSKNYVESKIIGIPPKAVSQAINLVHKDSDNEFKMMLAISLEKFNEKFKNSFKMGDIKEAKDLINTLRSEHKIKQKIKR